MSALVLDFGHAASFEEVAAPVDLGRYGAMPIPRFAGEQLSFDPPGYLFFGDNLEVLRRHVPDESVDLVYLDPPFNSNRSYNLLFEYKDGTKTAGQQKAFDDTWTWTLQSARLYEEIVAEGGSTSAMLRGMREILGTNDMLAYITMMTPRAIELHRVLKDTGSIYLHCDPTASHYLKIMLDSVFGPDNFRNEVIWWYRKWTKPPKHFLRNHQTLLFYAKSPNSTFNQLHVPLSASTLRRFGGKKQKFADDDRTRKVTDSEESQGAPRPDVWDINLIPAASAENLGYPTQKPLKLLEIIVAASSNPGDVVLDPFCGCGTTIDAAQRLDRRWIGIDITKVAIDVIAERMKKEFPSVKYVLAGEPATLEEAVVLAGLVEVFVRSNSKRATRATSEFVPTRYGSPRTRPFGCVTEHITGF